MSLKDLRADTSLSSAQDEMEHTEANLAAEPLAAHLAPEAEEKLAVVEATRVSQRAAKRQAVRAQAKINHLNRALDTLTRDFVLSLLATYKTRDAAGYRRYFPAEAPSVIIRKALESQLDDCAQWPDHLAAESNPTLSALAPRFAQVITDGLAAVKARTAAQTHTRNHRLDQIEPLITDLNTYRQRTYAALLTIATDNGLDKTWAREFFM